MTRKTLEDKVKDANTAFGNEYCPKVEDLGYYLMHGISILGLRGDSTVPVREKKKWCLVAYITKHEENPKIEPEALVNIARNIIPFKYKGFKVFLEYRKPLKARNESRPVPAYGVPHPRNDNEIVPNPRRYKDDDEEKWDKQND
ncbi:MAG: hypothetical protein V1734_01260 [Nanoarchaeota archaeon]